MDRGSSRCGDGWAVAELPQASGHTATLAFRKSNATAPAPAGTGAAFHIHDDDAVIEVLVATGWMKWLVAA